MLAAPPTCLRAFAWARLRVALGARSVADFLYCGKIIE
jgi:hypothetical protein